MADEQPDDELVYLTSLLFAALKFLTVPDILPVQQDHALISAAVIAKHFPGLGSADRSADEEISTIRKTLEELKSIELSPFFAVTGGAPDSESTVDGLLASHIRYQGLQGNIRSTTKPITFDQQAFNLVMQLPQLESWRANGGLIISDDLGSPAVRDFYQLTDQRFDITRRVALEALLAGNDLLYVSDFSSGTSNSYDSAKQTIEFFTQNGEDLLLPTGG
jgi:beta-N-acetylhexosaminidase